jgi:hypothetical protein
MAICELVLQQNICNTLNRRVIISGFFKTCTEHTANVQSISTTRSLSQRDGDTHNTLCTLINSTCISLCYHVHVCLKKGGKNTEDNKGANCLHLYVEETKEISLS